MCCRTATVRERLMAEPALDSRHRLRSHYEPDGTGPMSAGREIRCYDYVNHPYARVRDALSANAPAVFQSATKSAASRARSIASELRVNVAGIGVAADISISVTKIAE